MAMKYFLVGVLFCLLVNFGSSQNESLDYANLANGTAKTTIAPETTTTTPDTTTTAKTTTSSTTPSPDTTTSSTTTSTTTTTTTTQPTTTSTTTTAPTTTTTPSTTTAKTTTIAPTTTAAPNTTTAPPAPKPLPEPEVGSWILNNTSENFTCAVLHMALRMKIPYTVGENKTEWGMLNLPKDANITGKCDNTTFDLNMTNVRLWWDNNTNFLDITFFRDEEKKSFNISHLMLNQTISGGAFPDSTVDTSMVFAGNGSGLFSVEYVPLGSSYKCSHKVNINMTNTQDVNSTDAVLVFSKVQIQAFMYTASSGFGTVLECPGLDASDIVPIAVGCALAALVIGVLIAYLVGRRRSHARGYLSM